MSVMLEDDEVLVFDEIEVNRELCMRSFEEFVREFWDTVIPEPLVWNWHMSYLCDRLQIAAERVFAGEPKVADIVINVPPGTSKSTICVQMYPAWIWTRMAHARIIGGSYAHALAGDHSRRNRQIVESDKYKAYFPEIVLRDDQNVKSHFENTQGGGRYAVGTGGAVTGMHGHFILIDDPINPEEAMSETELISANRWMTETLSTRKVDKAVTLTVLIMQRLHQNDPTQNMLDRSSSVEHICLSADRRDTVKPKKLWRYYQGGLLDPKRMSASVLEQSRKTLGEYGFACQFDQSPIPRGGGMFKVERLQIDVPPRTFVRRIRYWDKAGTAGGGAYTVGVLMAVDSQGRYWILDIIRVQLDSADREARIKQTAVIDGPEVSIGVEQEPGSGGKESAQGTIIRLAGYVVFADRPIGDKTTRADPFSVQVNARNVYLVKGARWIPDLLAELEFFPYSKYRDQTDACSAAFGRLTGVRRRIGAG